MTTISTFHSGMNRSLTLNYMKIKIHIQSNLPMRSSLLKGHLFIVLSLKISYELNLF